MKTSKKDLVAKFFKIPKKYLLPIKPQLLDGIYRFVDTRTGYIYNYDIFSESYSTGLTDIPIKNPIKRRSLRRTTSPITTTYKTLFSKTKLS